MTSHDGNGETSRYGSTHAGNLRNQVSTQIPAVRNSITPCFQQLAVAPAGPSKVTAANERCVLLQCTISTNLLLLLKKSISCVVHQLIIHGAWSEVTSGRYCLAQGRHWKALGALALSSAGRGVIQLSAHEHCVLLQCTIHKNLHSPRIHSPRLVQHLIMAPA